MYAFRGPSLSLPHSPYETRISLRGKQGIYMHVESLLSIILRRIKTIVTQITFCDLSFKRGTQLRKADLK